MASGAELLRMLEPAVRPGNLPALQRPAAQPLEARSFDELLSEARASASNEATMAGGADESATVKDETNADALKRDLVRQLAQFDRIDNAALRDIVERAAGEANGEVRA